jgi:hypothetical protein
MITIITDFQSQRLEYVADTIFKKWLRVDYKIVSSFVEVDTETCCISYGNHSSPGSIKIFNEGLLSESNLRKELPAVSSHKNGPMIFEAINTHEFDLPFDVFSGVFFCLTRYEEYLQTQRDEHGRFKAEDSIFYGHQRIPYLDKWILALEILIQKKLPNWKNPRSLTWLSTMDMDIAFAFKGRNLTRRVGATAKDLLNLRFDRLRERAAVLSGRSADPFDTYELFLNESESDSKRLFVPVGDRSPFDNNLDVENEFIGQHISRLQKEVNIGLHPSYRSLGKVEMIEKEKVRLEKVSGGKIAESRQHFLRFSLPDTYQELDSLGIEKDYSLGFHDEVGFRSGTAFSHSFYDLLRDTALSIEIVPLTAMDSAMKNYLKLSTEEAIEVMEEILLHMKKSGGSFTTVWHNHSLSERDDWNGWRSVFESIPEMVRSHR